MSDRLSLRTQDLSPKDKDNPEGGKKGYCSTKTSKLLKTCRSLKEVKECERKKNYGTYKQNCRRMKHDYMNRKD